jgi:hypothetical protein
MNHAAAHLLSAGREAAYLIDSKAWREMHVEKKKERKRGWTAQPL